ncbi:MAG TPA: serine/threonine-protein kinase [Verrucomicrobiae bacterium]
MSAAAKCPRCGGDLAPSIPGGQCIGCLLELGLASEAPPGASESGAEQIGPYRQVRVMGEGQFSAVYLVEQEQPIRRRMALKIIKPGMHPEAAIARFEAGRQALATADHPNIVKVFEAGSTATGRPYFLMELAAGNDVARYCDTRRLPVLTRLELFTQICMAVQHIHQKGIVRCNIKTSNILVTEDANNPLAKIINLGMAGPFAAEKAAAAPGAAASGAPEMDTRADIYALGALLYELLTGQAPDEKAILPPSVRLATMPPQALDAAAGLRQTDRRGLVRLMRGELDWIVMKALKKDLNRRYDSASCLMGDVRHFLKNEMVFARPPGIVYPLEKWVQRHKSLIGAAVAVALAVIFTIAGMLFGFRNYYARPDFAKEIADSRAIIEARRQKQLQLHEVDKAKRGVAQQFDASKDFSVTNSNPNGLWAYSYSTDWSLLDGNLPNYAHGAWYDQWGGSGADLENSQVRRNFSDAPHDGCPPGGLVLHPGGRGFVHLIWTAPEEGTYWVSSRFDFLGSGELHAFVADRAGTNARMASMTMVKGSPALLYDSNLYLEKGEQLDFGAGGRPQGDPGNASIGLTLVIELYGGGDGLAPRE